MIQYSLSDFEKFVNTGTDLEIFASSYFQIQDHYIESNLKWIDVKEDGSGNIDVFELDVLAKKLEGNTFSSTLIECKRGCSFNDLFKFIGISGVVNADRNVLLCQSHQFEDLKIFGSKSNIDVVSLESLILYFDSQKKIDDMSFFLNSNILSNYLFDRGFIQINLNGEKKFNKKQGNAYKIIRAVMAELIGKVWRETSLIIKANQIKSLIDNNKNFVRRIAKELDIISGTNGSEYYINRNTLCESAAFLMLQIRISYIVCAVECSLAIYNGQNLNTDELEDTQFIHLIEKLADNIEISKKIPKFIQTFIYVFGGIFSDNDDLDSISTYLECSLTDTLNIIDLLRELFSLADKNIQWGFIEDMDVWTIRYAPNALKGLGIINREKLNIPTDFFWLKDQWLSKCNNTFDVGRSV